MSASFPNDFLWGASTSAHQVEGGQSDDWTNWEKINAKRLAAESSDYFSTISPVWSEIKIEACDPTNYRSEMASGHYDRYREDIQLLGDLNLNAYRFTIPWSRIEPREGHFDQAALDHYLDLVKRLRSSHIEPFPTLWHWPLPQWLATQGGWLAPSALDRFERFTTKVAETLVPHVTYWLTLNEPNVYASLSYLTGQWPPQHRSLLEYWRVAKRLSKAHRRAYAVIKQLDPKAQVGIAHHVTHFESASDPINQLLRTTANYYWNWSYLDPIANQLDFIGVNNYFRNRIDWGFNNNPHKHQSDLGWELHPPSLAGAVTATWQRYHKPIIVTEHGLADRADTQRQWFIEESLTHLHTAIERGVDVRGYLHWSLLDNFEWDKGFWPRFGLVAVDYTTQERTIRKSAIRYSEIAKQNSLG